MNRVTISFEAGIGANNRKIEEVERITVVQQSRRLLGSADSFI